MPSRPTGDAAPEPGLPGPARALWDLISYAIAAVPLGVGYRCAERLGDLVFHFALGYRASVLANLRRVFDEAGASDAGRLDAAAREVFRHSARDFYDLLRLRALPLAALRRSITPIGSWEAVERAVGCGTGAIFVTIHLGSFDFALQAIVLRGFPTIALTIPTVRRFLHDGLTYLRGSKGLELVEATRGISGLLAAALRGGTSVILANDRDFQRAGAPVDFFGRRTTLPPGAVRLARETGAPLVAVICRRHGHRHTIVIEEPVAVPRSGDAVADVRRGLAELVAILERHIRASPEQWVMFQRVWPEA